jgi:hypothetical protein
MQLEMLPTLQQCAVLKAVGFAIRDPACKRFSYRDTGAGWGVDTLFHFVPCRDRPSVCFFLGDKRFQPAFAGLIEIIHHPCAVFGAARLPCSLTN